MIYDSESLTLSLDVTINGTSVFSTQTTMTFGFSSNLSYLGASMVGSWVTSNRHETAYIDNMIFSVCSVSETINFDIKPGSCPNPLNTKSPKRYNTELMYTGLETTPSAAKLSSVFPGAILGTADFSVEDIDPTTIMLEGVPMQRWMIEDVGTPMPADAEECECNTDGADGFPDLTLKFDKSLIIQAIGEAENGDIVPLTITGELYNGITFEGTDCVIGRKFTQSIQSKDKYQFCFVTFRQC